MKDFAQRYFDLLNGEFSSINLTRINSFDEFYNKQIVDSIEPLTAIPTFKEDILKKGVVVDIGFGGGFPILPLAYLLPDIKFIGFEARRKKADVVSEIAKRLGIDNVMLCHNRVEEINFDLDCVVTFKAVGTVDKFLRLIKGDGSIGAYFYKGPSFDIDELPSVVSIKNWTLNLNKIYEVPGTEERKIVSFKNVPRGTFDKKNLVKLSKFI